tara:strand:+ start:852 stop:1343 length:492 start_codon:yes stop_codon:yes gene_type:complete
LNKKLIIVRHSKSSWKDSSLDDFNRPLNKRGKEDGPIISNYLSKKTNFIDFLHSSSSVRTFETSKFFTERIKFGKVKYDDSLYHSSSGSILNLIKNYSNEYSSVMLIAHNPGLTHLINQITNISLDNLPTTGLAEIHFSCNKWNEISSKNSNLIDLKFPKQLK